MKFDELRNQPILLFPTPKNEVHFADKDHVWINGRQYISLKRVGEMMKEKRMTNADRIRAMTDEQLAAYLGHASLCVTIQGEDGGEWCSQYGSCNECVRKWLGQEATDADN